MMISQSAIRNPQSAILTVVLVVLLLMSKAALAAQILVAAASDLRFAMAEIGREFENRTGYRVKVTLGSSGNFYSQILNGAPFEIFFSADRQYADKLQQAGKTDSESLRIYAIGRIVVWVPVQSEIDVEKLGMRSLLHPSVRKIAIANPRHAPYGRAAVAALRHFRLYETIRPKLIYGDNVSQTAQFVASGAAEIGIIALALSRSPDRAGWGKYWLIPDTSHPRLEQAVVVLKTGRAQSDPKAVRAFYDWVIGPSGSAVLTKYGFRLP